MRRPVGPRAPALVLIVAVACVLALSGRSAAQAADSCGKYQAFLEAWDAYLNNATGTDQQAALLVFDPRQLNTLDVQGCETVTVQQAELGADIVQIAQAPYASFSGGLVDWTIMGPGRTGPASGGHLPSPRRPGRCGAADRYPD